MLCAGQHGLELNMSSALSHVLADFFRSSTTLAESIAILWCELLAQGEGGAGVISMSGLGLGLGFCAGSAPPM